MVTETESSCIPSEIEFSIVMPCLNEAETVEVCVRKARESLDRLGIVGEVVVADNGSTDGSQDLAHQAGARVISVSEKGYGAALKGGIENARGRYLIMGDADDSYDFSHIDDFVVKLRDGNDLVMGCRLPSGGGTILPGAMPWLHRWVGNPVLSFIGRVFFKTRVRDFHCGLRGFSVDAYRRMDLQTSGMEFASEMVAKAALFNMRIAETPITLRPDGRSRAPHLKTLRDGWLHLRFLLVYTPRWLFFYPGLLLLSIGLIGMILLTPSQRTVGTVMFDVHTLLVSGAFVILGVQSIWFSFAAMIYGMLQKLIPKRSSLDWLQRASNQGFLVIGSLCLVLIGFAAILVTTIYWESRGFGTLPYQSTLRVVIPGVVLICVGAQSVFSVFLIGLFDFRNDRSERNA